jgi:uncharacterized protein (DUF2236 family)
MDEAKVWVAIGRASDFFGPRVLASAVGEQVFGRLLLARALRWPETPINCTRTHTHQTSEKDWPSSASRRRHWAGTWHLPNTETTTTREFVQTVFEEVGRPARIQAAPKFVLRTLGLFNPALRETIEMLYEFEDPFIVNHSRFARTFGDHATPLREAIGRTVRWYRDERPTA